MTVPWNLEAWNGLSTPFLALDVAILDRNLDRAQRFCDEQGLSLRPHAKTHKLREIAERQTSRGSVGLTVATIDEAERFATAGFTDLFLAYSLYATDAVARRLLDLAERVRLTVAVDSRDVVDALHRCGLNAYPGLSLLVEVDSGLHRTGVCPAEAATIGTHAVDRGFDVAGIYTYPGHGYAIGEQREAARNESRSLERGVEEFEREGLVCRVRSGGSTPTLFATEKNLMTELRPGVYALNDAQQVTLGTADLSDVALVVVATVCAVPDGNRLVLDAGSKAVASDRPAYVNGHGLILGLPDSTIERIWEHHAVVDVSREPASHIPKVGDRVAVVPNHVCTTINLSDRVYALDGDELTAWYLLTRGVPN